MENDDQKENPVFPPEYAHLEEPLNEAREQIRQIDQEIENLRGKKGPTLSFRPPGGGDPNSAYQPHRTEKRLNQFRDQIASKVEKQVAKELRNAEPKQAAHLKEMVKHKLSRAEDRDKTPEQLNAIRKEVKKDSKSFDYMGSLHFSRFSHKKDDVKVEPAKEGQEKESQRFNMDEMSDRFMDKLKRQPDKRIEDRSPSKDDHEIDKE